MNKGKTLTELNNFKNKLHDDVLQAYQERGTTYGRERFSAWRNKFTKFLNLMLPNETSNFNAKLHHIILTTNSAESDAQHFWRQDGETCESFIDSLVVDIQNDEYDFEQYNLMNSADILENKGLDYKEGYAFIIMTIDSSNHELVDVLDAIKFAANEYKINAERIDESQSNEKITDRILESIKKAEIIIADLTYPKPNVYYEAGYAQALNKTPIYIAKKDTQLEFDLKDYPVIFFNNMKELKDGLNSRLKEIMKTKA